MLAPLNKKLLQIVLRYNGFNSDKDSEMSIESKCSSLAPTPPPKYTLHPRQGKVVTRSTGGINSRRRNFSNKLNPTDVGTLCFDSIKLETKDNKLFESPLKVALSSDSNSNSLTPLRRIAKVRKCVTPTANGIHPLVINTSCGNIHRNSTDWNLHDVHTPHSKPDNSTTNAAVDTINIKPTKSQISNCIAPLHDSEIMTQEKYHSRDFEPKLINPGGELNTISSELMCTPVKMEKVKVGDDADTFYSLEPQKIDELDKNIHESITEDNYS